MIDISDGLALDLSRLCAASGTGARVRIGAIPVHPAATRDEAIGGGEDYELLATLPSAEAVRGARDQLREAFGVPLTEIGDIIEEGLIAVDEQGVEGPLPLEGWEHFR
jgi:thiamine-monophosphate kinase